MKTIKNSTSKLFRIGTLIIGFLLFFISSCETENELAPRQMDKQKHDYHIKRVKLSEIETNRKLTDKLSELENSLRTKSGHANRINSFEGIFSIDTNEGIYIENGNGTHHTYTFAVETQVGNSNIENIILSLQ